MRLVQSLILLPVAAQVFLTLAVLIIMGVRRHAFLNRVNKGYQDLALANKTDWDVSAQKAQNNLANQFELPVLFYVACGFALALREVDAMFLFLATAFVLARIGHTIAHITANIVVVRASFWFVSLFAVIVMWIALVVRVISSEL